MLFLVKSTVPEGKEHSEVGVMDVRRGNLFKQSRSIPNVEALLMGQAQSFQTIWDNI